MKQDEDDGGGVKLAVDEENPTAQDTDEPSDGHRRPRRWPLALTAVVVVALTVVSVGLWRDHTQVRAEHALGQRYLQAARQGVLNLTSISAETVDADTERVLAESTGAFKDDFSTRAADFVAVVKQANVTAVGTITEAGLESMDSDTAKVLVAASSKVTNSSGAQEEPRIWRLRVTLTDVGGAILVSNVEFVP